MLTQIAYPVELKDLVIVGYTGPRSRNFTIRPQLHGDYQFAIWPKQMPDARWVVTHLLAFPTQGGPPERITFDLDAQRLLNDVLEWEWALVRLSNLRGKLPASEVLFNDMPVARGEIALAPKVEPTEVRTIVWSCNQPFDTVNGQAELHEYVGAIMDWYPKVVAEFAPDTIWGAGDTAYSDGTDATNFADQVYDHPGWSDSPEAREWLRDAYRRMYRYHWSLPGLHEVAAAYPHILMWDDHEIRDGWGSEANDFEDGNAAMLRIARGVAEEYVLNMGPRVRHSLDADAHQAYMVGSQANFIFDSRTSRNYGDKENPGRIISAAQLADFRAFNDQVADNPNISFYFVGSTVPLVYVKTFWTNLGSEAPKFLTDLVMGARDDMRDSWDSPNNEEALKELIDAIGDLLLKRPDLHIVILSGDVHVANAFEIWPPGFIRPIYQVTTSAITNRGHIPELASDIAQMGQWEGHAVLGLIRRLWPEILDPNVLCITTSGETAKLHLRVLPVDDSKATDQVLELS